MENCKHCGTLSNPTCPECNSHPSLVGQVLEARWQVTGLLGQGAMGAVYRAEHAQLGRAVAIKMLLPELSAHPEMLARFRREALAASRLAHPHIVATLDVGSHQGAPYLVMEFVDGASLEQMIRREGPLPISRVLRIAHQLAHALGSAHQAGIIHRDIKPANIMVTNAGLGEQAKIMDFGIALIEDADGGLRTSAGMIMGTPNYISPEQVSGSSGDSRTDVYSLGATLYEMLTGQAPFVLTTVRAILHAHLLQEPTPPSRLRDNIPEGLEALILSMLQKDPNARPQHGIAVAASLEKLSAIERRSPPKKALLVLGMSTTHAQAAKQISWLIQELTQEGGSYSHIIRGEAVGVLPHVEAAFRLTQRASLQDARFAIHWGEASLDKDGIASGRGVQIALSLARVTAPGETLLTSSAQEELGVGLRSYTERRGALRLREAGDPTPVFQARSAHPQQGEPTRTEQRGGSLLWVCSCGHRGSLSASGAMENPRVKCPNCSRLLQLEPAEILGQTLPPEEKPPPPSQVLAKVSRPGEEKALDHSLIDALSEFE